MCVDDRIADILSRWEEQQRAGQTPTLAALCREAPELTATVSHHIRALRATSWLDEELGAARGDGADDGAAITAVVRTTHSEFVAALHKFHILETNQLREVDNVLASQLTDAKGLARELLRQNWLTAYQANLLLQGRGSELRLASYVLLERLGEGGMGAVFKARNWKLGNVVAVKVIRKDRLSGRDTLRRFLREIRAAAALEHPNIVRTIDADEQAGNCFMVMECVEGIDLSRKLKQSGPLEIAQACDYIRQAALGLQHAYELGLVHRDIKPGNLFLANDGTVKLLDMGLAKIAQDATTQDSTVTQEGSVMGTPDFIAPEQALDSHTADVRADLYSLGCTFYTLLTGQAPFPGGTLTQKLLKHQQSIPQPADAVRPGIPQPICAIVEKLMAKRPNERFQTPAELVEALDAKPVPAPTADPSNPHFDFAGDTDTMTSIRSEATVEETPLNVSRARVAILAVVALAIVAGLAMLLRTVLQPTEPPPIGVLEEPPVQPPQFVAAPEATAARRIAEWALNKNSKSHIAISVPPGKVDDSAQLPNTDFEIVSLSMQYCDECAIEPLKYLQSLSRPIAMDFTYVAITDEHMRYIAEADCATVLTLYGTKVTNKGLQSLPKMRRLTHLSLRTGGISGAGLVHVKPLIQLKSFGLAYVDSKDEDLANLSGLVDLTEIFLMSTNTSDRGLKHLAPLTKMQKLVFTDNPRISDAGLTSLSKMKSLDNLQAVSCNVSGVGIQHLQCAESLKHLHLGTSVFDRKYGAVTDAGLEQVARFSNLEGLIVSGKTISDDGLMHIGKLTNLKTLWVAGPLLTDAGLKHLYALTGLRKLTVDAPKITEAGLAAFRKALPKCEVVEIKKKR